MTINKWGRARVNDLTRVVCLPPPALLRTCHSFLASIKGIARVSCSPSRSLCASYAKPGGRPEIIRRSVSSLQMRLVVGALFGSALLATSSAHVIT
jgi:hypothetical protein